MNYKEIIKSFIRHQEDAAWEKHTEEVSSGYWEE